MTLTHASVPSSTWVRSKSSSWRGIGGSGTVWPLTPAERKNLVCRCLDSWVASTTSCQMRPLAPWLSSHLVRDAKVTKCAKILTHHRFICIFFGNKLSDQFRPEQKGYKWLLSETLGFKSTRKYKMTLKLRLFMYFSLPPSRNKRYFCSSLSCWEDHLHAQLLFTAPGRPQDGRPKGERLQWIRLQTPAVGFGHLYYLPKPGVGSLITYFYISFLKNNINLWMLFWPQRWRKFLRHCSKRWKVIFTHSVMPNCPRTQENQQAWRHDCIFQSFSRYN